MECEGTQRLAYRVSEIQKALGLGRNKVYELISSGQLGHIRAGTAILVPKHALDKFLGAAE